jgi:hypothetical protein
MAHPPHQEPRTVEARVRALGFNPRHLTPREQRELLELQMLDAAGARDPAVPRPLPQP